LKQAGKREIDLVLGVSLILLGVQYDDLSDTGFIDGRDEMVSMIEVWPRQLTCRESRYHSCSQLSMLSACA